MYHTIVISQKRTVLVFCLALVAFQRILQTQAGETNPRPEHSPTGREFRFAPEPAMPEVSSAIVHFSSVIPEDLQLNTSDTEVSGLPSELLFNEGDFSLPAGWPSIQRRAIRSLSHSERKTQRLSVTRSVPARVMPQQIAEDVLLRIAQQQPAGTAFDKIGEANAEVENQVQTEIATRVDRLECNEKQDRLIITNSGRAVAEYVFRDEKILRPYFSNIYAPGGLRVTRNHPPIAGIDAVDHDTMHPGLWLAFGDISGSDFWRNKGRIEHLRFSAAPSVNGDRLTFTTESRLITNDGLNLCQLISRYIVARRPTGWLIVWDAAFHSDEREFTFGDQEEMGFGARVATPLTEKRGGQIVNSQGQTKAANTWGQPATWCDYSGIVEDQNVGITLMASPSNVRESWWHNRDYGFFAANLFARAAMKQGDRSALTVKRGETFRVVFGSLLHSSPVSSTATRDPAAAYADFLTLISP